MPVVVDGQPLRRRIRARLNDFRVRSDSADLAFGDYEPGHDVVWLWHDVVGWWSTPDLETSLTAVGTTDLHVAGPRFPAQPRQLTVVGTCVTGSTAEAMAARDRLVAAWGDPDREHGLIVEEPGSPKRVNVRLAGEITMPWARPTRTFAFEIPLVAADPVKYALTSSSVSTPPAVGGAYTITFPVAGWPLTWQGSGQRSGIVAATNAGNRPSWPVLRITGPATPGWRVSNLTTGQSLGLDLRIGTGQELTLDTRRGRATIGGRRVAARLSGQWWALARGQNRIQFTVPSYQADQVTHMSVIYSSAWR